MMEIWICAFLGVFAVLSMVLGEFFYMAGVKSALNHPEWWRSSE